jgi:hypothetical protein
MENPINFLHNQIQIQNWDVFFYYTRSPQREMEIKYQIQL